MKKLKLRIQEDLTEDVLTILDGSKYERSNPDQTQGECIDVIQRGNQKLFGFDMFLNNSSNVVVDIRNKNDLNIITDWLNDS